MRSPLRTEATIIGCGAIGLTTARTLQDRGFKVGIYAKDLPLHTTSNVAAGAFGVTSLVDDGHHTEDITAASRGHALRLQIFRGTDRWLLWRALDGHVHAKRKPGGIVLRVLHHPGAVSETDVFLPALMDELRQRGARIEVREFADLASLQSIEAPLIANCTGLGAKALFGDAELTPVKGQLTVLKPQPEVTYAYLDGVLDF